MKYLLVMVIVLVAAVAAEEEWKPIRGGPAVQDVHNECLKQNPLTAEQIEKVYRMENSDEKEIQAYVLCSVKKLGFFTDDKGYNVDRLVAQFEILFDDVDKLRDIVVNCVQNNEQNSTPAELAIRGQQCLMNSMIGQSMQAALQKRKGSEQISNST